ncbi:Copper homeostasis protein CutC [termite gut metagenome]|uniref:Copper homeostasis protein cutC homolog n=1 Tax=termite gut metagenome TaxID=433724 RepID=A0A5J4RWG3_9ZZZZ
MYKVEICANSAESCVAAQTGGAWRVELCAGIPEGGTTPSYGEIVTARELITIKLHVIIRPRGGDFLYTAAEMKSMERDISMACDAGADGVVFGCLTADGNIDAKAVERLQKAAKGLPITFHRAFDKCVRPQEALEQLIDLGCNRILTSGQRSTAEAGIPLLKELVEQAGSRIIIMPGCGINEDNIARIAHQTGAQEFHFSARENKESGMIHRDAEVSMGGTVTIDEYLQPVTSVRRVRNTIEALPAENSPD